MSFILITSIRAKAHTTEIGLEDLLLVLKSILSVKDLAAEALIIQIINKSTHFRGSRTESRITVKFASISSNLRT